MPYVFLLIGLALVISSIEGTYNQLGAQLKQDFTGKGGFQYWAAAIAMIGALGYIDAIRPVTNKMLWLVLIVLFLANGGVWNNLVNALQQGPISPKKKAGVHVDVQGVGESQSHGFDIAPKPSANALPNLPDLSKSSFIKDLEAVAPIAMLAL